MIHNGKIGYKRDEFRKIFQIYSSFVYQGLFRDFSFAEIDGRYFISFREEAGKTPLITVEKQKIGPDRSLFVATTPSSNGQPQEIVRSEKIDVFVTQLREKIDKIQASRKDGKVINLR